MISTHSTAGEDSSPTHQLYTISARPPAFLRELSHGIASGEVFHSRMLECEEEAFLVFLPLTLMHQSQRERLWAADLGLIYEWRSKARPATPAELPEFLSCGYLNKADTEQVLAWAQDPHVTSPKYNPIPATVDDRRAQELQIKSDDSDVYEVLFLIGHSLYSFVIARMTSSGQYSCAFALCDQDGVPAHFGISGTGKQHEVFSTVVRLLRAWIDVHRPVSLSFVAKEKTRERLYRRISRRFAPSWGYSAHEETNANGHTIFAFHRLLDPKPQQSQIGVAGLTSTAMAALTNYDAR